MKVLIVEDDTNDFVLLEADLKTAFENKVEVEHAESFEIAQSCLQNNKYDIVFVDNNLQDGVGAELIELSSKQDRDLPFVLITGEMNVDLDVVAVEHGADDFIEKSQITAQLLRRSIPYTQGLKKMRNKVEDQAQEIEALKVELAKYQN